MVIVAETRADEPRRLHDEVVERVCDVVGIPPLEVILVQPGSLPKTSSGKLQRSLCRRQYLDDELLPA
jgi:fatty-acyl-CoA synthase